MEEAKQIALLLEVCLPRQDWAALATEFSILLIQQALHLNVFQHINASRRKDQENSKLSIDFGRARAGHTLDDPFDRTMCSVGCAFSAGICCHICEQVRFLACLCQHTDNQPAQRCIVQMCAGDTGVFTVGLTLPGSRTAAGWVDAANAGS